MLSLNAVPNSHLHNRVLQQKNLGYTKVVSAVVQHRKYPGYAQLLAAAGSLSRIANSIISAANATSGIPFVGIVVAAVLQVIGALTKLAASAFTAVAGLLVLIVNRLSY
ncbi:MAG: hypothetical protein R3C53_15775 [Pirellulaceae bacterium]